MSYGAELQLESSDRLQSRHDETILYSTIVLYEFQYKCTTNYIPISGSCFMVLKDLRDSIANLEFWLRNHNYNQRKIATHDEAELDTEAYRAVM